MPAQPKLDILPLAAIRARKVSALLALAHLEGVPVPTSVSLTSHANLADLEFSATPDEFAAWSKWLGATPCRDYPGSEHRSATATAHLEEWGPVSVRFTTRRAA